MNTHWILAPEELDSRGGSTFTLTVEGECIGKLRYKDHYFYVIQYCETPHEEGDTLKFTTDFAEVVNIISDYVGYYPFDPANHKEES